ncbi:ABC transporter permease [Bacillus marasmi]|uniref:ABC transporter permease n=1 Tax=Bacillus marasmi TaxID=1926279 RepID=UPI0011CAD657|nr:ABC transporter permease [Bacillus marasmi]
MSFFWLAVKDLLLTCRDKKALLTLIAMPLLLIAILGAAFGNVFQEEGNVTIDKFTLGIVNHDNGDLGKVLTEDVFSEALSEQIRVKSLDENELNKQIETRKLSIGIIIPDDFSTNITTGKEAKVKLISVPNPGIKATIVQSVLEQFTQSVAVEAELTKIAMQQALQSGMTIEQFQAGLSDASQEQEINPDSYKNLVTEKTVKADSEPVGAFQYYAAAMGVMFLLITVTDGVSAMIQEKEQEVYKRLLVSKLSFGNYLTGKMLGLIVISLIQASVIIIGTTILFDVDWGSSLSGIVLNTFAFVMSACGLGVLVGSFIKKEKTFSVAAMLGTQIMAALGGSMAPLYIFPDWAVLAGKFLPNGLALQTYLDLMSDATFIEVIPEAAISLGIGIVFFAIGLMRLSIERRGSYA